MLFLILCLTSGQLSECDNDWTSSCSTLADSGLDWVEVSPSSQLSTEYEAVAPALFLACGIRVKGHESQMIICGQEDWSD